MKTRSSIVISKIRRMSGLEMTRSSDPACAPRRFFAPEEDSERHGVDQRDLRKVEHDALGATLVDSGQPLP